MYTKSHWGTDPLPHFRHKERCLFRQFFSFLLLHRLTAHTYTHTLHNVCITHTLTITITHTHSLFTHSFAHKNTTTAPYCNLIQSPQNSKPQAAQNAHSSAQYSQPTRTEGNSPQRAGVHARSSVEPRRCTSVHHRCVQVGAT